MYSSPNWSRQKTSHSQPTFVVRRQYIGIPANELCSYAYLIIMMMIVIIKLIAVPKAMKWARAANENTHTRKKDMIFVSTIFFFTVEHHHVAINVSLTWNSVKSLVITRFRFFFLFLHFSRKVLTYSCICVYTVFFTWLTWSNLWLVDVCISFHSSIFLRRLDRHSAIDWTQREYIYASTEMMLESKFFLETTAVIMRYRLN